MSYPEQGCARSCLSPIKRQYTIYGGLAQNQTVNPHRSFLRRELIMAEFVTRQFFDATIGVPSRYDTVVPSHFAVRLARNDTTRYTNFQAIGEGAASGLISCVPSPLSNKIYS